MLVTILREAGYKEAMLELSLSYQRNPADMPTVAVKLTKTDLDSGHQKFLEMMDVWLDIHAPLNWWNQMDTYRAPQNAWEPTGVTKGSSSTMHRLLARPAVPEDFEREIDPASLAVLNRFIAAKDLTGARDHLPWSYIQRRVVKTNYKVLAYILKQRQHHRNPSWDVFISAVLSQIQHPELLAGDNG